MNTKHNPPAENPDQANLRQSADTGRPDPGTFAHQLFEHLADVHGDADADLYASRIVVELFELSPITREHISDLILVDLTEELHRRGEQGKDAARMVAEVQRDWMQGA